MELIDGNTLTVIKVRGYDEAYFYDRYWCRWGTGELATPTMQNKLTEYAIQHSNKWRRCAGKG